MVGSVERTMYFEFYVSIGLFISKIILTQKRGGESEGRGDLQVVEEPRGTSDKRATCGMYN